MEEAKVNKEHFLKVSKSLEERHEQIKSEMLKIVEASKILNEQYENFEKELYNIEQQYVANLKNIVD